VAISVLYLIILDPVMQVFSAWQLPFRFLITAVLLAPVSFFMGWMFPTCMDLLEQRDIRLIPWAWGINGFASVCAAPLAVMLSMSFGFRAVVLIALVLYITCGVVIGQIESEA
ncbi:MAG: SAM-dependent methyltransferase, partial [Nitrospirota bacterium]